MHKTLITALALGAAATAPALAQDTGQDPARAQPGGQEMQAQQGATQGMTEEQMRSRIASQAQVREALTASGFEEIALLDAAYLVSARAPSGELVMMVVNPSGLMQGMMQGGGQDATGATGSTGATGTTGQGTPMQEGQQPQTNQ